MAKRRLNAYTTFMAAFLRAKMRPGMSVKERQQVMREGATAWKRAKRGQNPFPELEIEIGPSGVKIEQESHGEETASCPDCGQAVEVPTDLDGKVVQCPNCGATLTVEVV